MQEQNGNRKMSVTTADIWNTVVFTVLTDLHGQHHRDRVYCHLDVLFVNLAQMNLKTDRIQRIS
jgi:hypothetical protein